MLPSPCTKDCKLDPATGLCRGCLRTMQEILRWGTADEQEQARILAAVAKRREQPPGSAELSFSAAGLPRQPK